MAGDGAPRFHSISILLVEENPADVRLTIELLREAKLANRLRACGSGREALEILRRDGPYAQEPLPDIVLLDVDRETVDGQAIITEMRTDPVLRHIAVLLMTGSASTRDAMSAEGLAADGFLRKPLDLNEFVHTVCALDRFWLDVVCAPYAG
jgi:two-component system, chemotaxis family, response regulator Rcp1